MSTLAWIAACSGPAEEARKRYEFLEQQHASLGELCTAAKQWRQAIIDKQDAAALQDWQVKAGGACLHADILGAEQSFGEASVQADNMEAVVDNRESPAPLNAEDNSEIGRNEFQGD